MIKSRLMHRYKEKFGGSYTKENGRWFWIKGKEKHLVTTGRLLHDLKNAKTTTKSKPKAETQKPVEPVIKEVKPEIQKPVETVTKTVTKIVKEEPVKKPVEETKAVNVETTENELKKSD